MASRTKIAAKGAGRPRSAATLGLDEATDVAETDKLPEPAGQ